MTEEERKLQEARFARSEARRAFRDAARFHFAHPPSTWAIHRDRYTLRNPWYIGIADGSVGMDHYPSRKQAQEALDSGDHFARRNWESTDAWYRGTSTDERLRALEEWEKATIAEIIAELGV